jgi:hypothetical protein
MSGRGPVLTVALALCIAVAPGCRNPPDVSFDLTVPNAVSSATTWYEIGAYRGTTCDTLLPVLGGGLPLNGASQRLAFKKTDKAPPPLGNLPKDNYAFGATARKRQALASRARFAAVRAAFPRTTPTTRAWARAARCN